MPATWDLPRNSGIWDSVEIDRFNRLPVHCAEQSTKQLPRWQRWQKLYSTRKWTPNMGDLLQGVIAELPPITKQNHAPRNITESPLKTVVSHYERTNQARVKRHFFESPLIHFLPSFRDFRTNQIPKATEALNKIVSCGTDFFLRWQSLQYAPRIGICGAAAKSDRIIGTTTGEGTDTSSPKDAALFANLATKVGNNTGFLDFRWMVAFRDYFTREFGALPWDGVPAAPKENETCKGKFILMGEGSLYDALQFDKHVLNFKDQNVNLINSGFRGIISGNIAFMEECYPHRMAADGTFPEPELELYGGATANATGNASQYETIPNPDYVNAPFGLAYLMGYQPFESIKVGPPPAEFAKKSISMGRYHQLNWNGEIRLTDDVLVNYGSGVLDTNKYGEWLQLICDTTLAILPNTPRHILPIMYRRMNAPSIDYDLTA